MGRAPLLSWGPDAASTRIGLDALESSAPVTVSRQENMESELQAHRERWVEKGRGEHLAPGAVFSFR